MVLVKIEQSLGPQKNIYGLTVGKTTNVELFM